MLCKLGPCSDWCTVVNCMPDFTLKQKWKWNATGTCLGIDVTEGSSAQKWVSYLKMENSPGKNVQNQQ